MNDYVHRALKKFNHISPSVPQQSPHIWNKPVYGQKTAHQPTDVSTAASLYKDGTWSIQYISGTFLYYSEIEPFIKPSINEISSE